MDWSVSDLLVVQCLLLLGNAVVALLIVLFLRRNGPVWGVRAAHASLAALAVTFLIGPSRTIADGSSTWGSWLLLQCAVVALTTGLGSRHAVLPKPGSVRQASIAPRRLFVLRVPPQRVAMVVTGLVALAVITLASVMGDGTTLARSHRGASGAASGFPGWPTQTPTLWAGLILALVVWWALVEIRDRPRINEPLDTLLRARDASRVLRAATFGYAATSCSLLFTIGARMNEATQMLRSASEVAPRAPWDVYQLAGFALYVPATVMGLVAFGALVGSVGSRDEVRDLEFVTWRRPTSGPA